MAAVTALVMFMLAGLAIDVALIVSAKNRVRRALDAAGIAIATNFRDVSATEEEVTDFTVKWVQTNFPDYKIGEYFDLRVTWANGQADLAAKVRVDTIFMDLVGSTEIDADVNVRVISETRGIEVAIAVDNTGSMNGTEMVWLRSSVNQFIDTLFSNAPDPSQVMVGIVPFVAAVNVKDPGEFATWIDAANPEDVIYMDDDVTSLEPLVPYHGDYYNPRRSHAFLYKLSATAKLQPHWYYQWKGCVEARAITYNGVELDLNDVPPDPAVPETLFVPYLWPDGPDLGGSSGSKDSSFTLITSDASLWDGSTLQTPNNYLKDLVDSSFTWSQRLESIASWLDPSEILNVDKSRDETAPITSGPSMACPEHILPLTTDAAYLKNKINNKHLDFFHNGGTNIPQGIMWAWRVLSKDPPFSQGSAFVNDDGTENKKVDKIILLFVDGGNGIVYNDNPMYSNYSAYGYVKPGGRLDPAGVNDLNTKTLKVCQNARAPSPGFSREKIIIYAIAFKVDSTSPVLDMLRECTGSADQVFLAADTGTLYATFESLAKQLTKLRVVY
jgi:Flp pilus assembly protein TadG